MPMTSPTGPSKRTTRGASPRAFTLLELILVLGVMALSAAMAAPALSRFSRGRQTVDAAAHLLAVIHYAQNQAVITASPYRLQLDPTTGKYWLAAQRDGAFARLATEFGRDFELPKTTMMQWDASSEIVANGYVLFSPDGSHDVASIKLVASDGETIAIGSDSPSEPFRITQGREETTP